jgi:hypothetical protein
MNKFQLKIKIIINQSKFNLSLINLQLMRIKFDIFNLY